MENFPQILVFKVDSIYISNIEICPDSTQYLFACRPEEAGYSHLYYSTNNGESWDYNLQVRGIGSSFPISISLNDPNTIYASNWKTTNRGITWTELLDLPPSPLVIRSIAIHPENNQIVFLGTFNDVYKTVDGGLSWEIVFSTEYDIEKRVIFDRTGNLIYMNIYGEGVFKSSDLGNSWQGINNQLNELTITSWCFHPTTNSLFIGSEGNGFFLSNNLGDSWSNVSSGLPDFYGSSLVVIVTGILI